MAVMDDRGFFLTLQAIRRQLAAMPNELYLIRLIHRQTRRPFPGERLWTASQLASPPTVRFLRARNREGCDVYVLPFAGDRNAGYILVDLDRADLAVVDKMRTHGHHPCVVIETSPGHLQAWVRLSTSPLESAAATAVSKQLARIYGADLASTDWRHLGRLAGFTNQKPQRLTPAGYAPWVKVVHTHAGLAPQADALLQSVCATAPVWPSAQGRHPTLPALPGVMFPAAAPSSISTAEANRIYCDCMQRWNIHQRFSRPDWSIVDLWVARQLLSLGTPHARVQEILRLASPHFPRRHGNPDDYLRRTLVRAVSPRPRPPVCADHAGTSARPAADNTRSNSAGGR
jgi:hypothetical protein